MDDNYNLDFLKPLILFPMFGRYNSISDKISEKNYLFYGKKVKF